MLTQTTVFKEEQVLHKLAHFLPAQFPLKDFVHHNTLHAFQHENFHAGLKQAAAIFGYHVYPKLEEYRKLYRENKISDAIIEQVILSRVEKENLEAWRHNLLDKKYNTAHAGRIGRLRIHWKEYFRVNLDKEVYPVLFRLIGNYLDQGVSIWAIPKSEKGFLDTIRNLEKESFTSLFKGDTAKELLQAEDLSLEKLLKRVVGKEEYYEQYLFDMQFSHPGWSGMVSVVEHQPETLLDNRTITLREFIIIELLMEIDVLERKLGKDFQSLSSKVKEESFDLFGEVEPTELDEVFIIWQEALEWTYFDQVLKGLMLEPKLPEKKERTFQAMFCIDDRESSLRTYLELIDPNCETFGTAGFFNLAIYFRPEHGLFHTKVCPLPLQPQHIIVEKEASKRHKKDTSFGRHNQGFFTGWLTAQTLGFWSALKMTRNIFMPAESPAMVSSFKHMDPKGKLSIERRKDEKIDDLWVGFTIEEMTDRVEGILKSIGLTENFAPVIYFVGHGASSINNTYYAGYDCGACSGRAGSVNARVAANIANRKEVREGLKARGIDVPESTRFIGGLHDTTRDEMEFYDLDTLSKVHQEHHEKTHKIFNEALQKNAKERARRFILIDNNKSSKKVHEDVKLRSLSLFEPRPEWNHATNALCIVGKRESHKHLFLDRRAFLQSYDYKLDPEGTLLLGVLNAVTPVCGGINLEYYFSRVDNKRMGAGSKLPHNVMGLIGVANGMEGDLRTGLPEQMVNIHDPLRLMLTVEHYPNVVADVIRKNPGTFEWFKNEWVLLAVVHPETKKIYRYTDDFFVPYTPLTQDLPFVENISHLVSSTSENIPVQQFKV